MGNKKHNCWEFKKCGREPGGINVDKEGVCPASILNSYHGLNNGLNGGRFCWVISGTMCDGEVQGTYAQKLEDCINCEFLKKVDWEEGRDFILSPFEKKK